MWCFLSLVHKDLNLQILFIFIKNMLVTTQEYYWLILFLIFNIIFFSIMWFTKISLVKWRYITYFLIILESYIIFLDGNDWSLSGWWWFFMPEALILFLIVVWIPIYIIWVSIYLLREAIKKWRLKPWIRKISSTMVDGVEQEKKGR